MRPSFPPLLQLVLCAVIAWIASIYCPTLDYHSPVASVLGWLLVILGGVILLGAVGLFAKEKTTVDPTAPEKTNVLVTSGAYRFSRNPMCLGMATVLTGTVLVLQNFLGLILVPLFVLSITYLQILPEERALRAKFGTDFETYHRSTARWI